MRFDPLYVVLGLLDEYGGRVIEEGGDAIDRFYESEAESALCLGRWLRRLSAERGIEEPVRIERVHTYTILKSAALAALVNERYEFEWKQWGADVGDGGHSVPARNGTGMITLAMFATAATDQKLSFLAGAYARYGGELRTYRFANAEHKARVLMRLLEELGCADVSLETVRGVPNANTVNFRPSAAVRAALTSFAVETQGPGH